MPQLNGKKYAYTKKGKEQYEKDKQGKYTKKKNKKPGLAQKKYSLSEAKQKLKKMGRRGDTELEHVNKDEQRMLRRMGSARSTNPRTGLKENFFGGGGGISFNVPKINIPKSTGDIVKGVQKSYDVNVKGNLPKGLDYQNVGKKMLETANATEEFVGGAVTNIGRAVVGTAAQILTGTNPYTQSSDSGSGSGTTTMSGSGGESGFGGMKRRKKRKKPGEAEGDSQGQNTQGGKMSKRGLRTPKRTGLNIVKKNSSSTSLGM